MATTVPTVTLAAVAKKGGQGKTRAVTSAAVGVGHRRPDLLVAVLDLDPQAHATLALLGHDAEAKLAATLAANLAAGGCPRVPPTALGWLQRAVVPHDLPARAFVQQVAPNIVLLPGDPALEVLAHEFGGPLLLSGAPDAPTLAALRRWAAQLRLLVADLEHVAGGLGFSGLLVLVDTAQGFGTDPLSFAATVGSDHLLLPLSDGPLATRSASDLLRQCRRLQAGDAREAWVRRQQQVGDGPAFRFAPVSLVVTHGADAEQAGAALAAATPGCAAVRGYGDELLDAAEALLRLACDPAVPASKRRRRV